MTFPAELLSQCWFLAGPTASGKTAASLILAARINAEIVALDSMTLYRGMDVGTAKPTPDEQQQIRHHLIDILDPEDEFSLAEYVARARDICAEIVLRGRIPLFVGGTGLYLRGILRGVFDGPPADWSLRNRLENQAQQIGPGGLHELLRRVDPLTADRLHPHDKRRVIRALEVYELTGQPLSNLQQQGPRPIGQRPDRVCWLSPPRDWLYERIDRRVERMFAEGLVDEVQQLLQRSKPFSQTARQALGYKEVMDWLELPSSTEPRISVTADDIGRSPPPASLVQLIQTRTRQFAKRQHTWFRNLEECRAISIMGHETPAQICDLIML